MHQTARHLSLLALVMTGCAHGSATPDAETVSPRAPGNGVAQLERQARRQRSRIAELEARVALLEQEARRVRVVARPHETVRIGAARASRDAGDDSDDSYAPYESARDEQAPAAAPVLRLYGSKSAPVADLEPLPTPPPGVSMALPVIPLPANTDHSDDDARKQYGLGLKFLRSQDYAEAQTAFEQFVARYPGHPLADNAAYWLGEVHYAKRDYGRALESFEVVLSRYPGGNKVPDALLKLALCHRRLGDSERAARYFQRVQQEFPKSKAAHIASREGSS